MGCAMTRTQRGVTITGSRSTSARSISNERLPDPITIEARNSITGTPESRSARPTSCRLRRCGESSAALVAQAAEIHDAAHARGARGAPEVSGPQPILRSEARRPPIEWTR